MHPGTTKTEMQMVLTLPLPCGCGEGINEIVCKVSLNCLGPTLLASTYIGKSCQMALMHYPKEEQDRNELKDEIGMAVSKSTQTTFVRLITSTTSLYPCFLSTCRTRQ